MESHGGLITIRYQLNVEISEISEISEVSLQLQSIVFVLGR